MDSMQQDVLRFPRHQRMHKNENEYDTLEISLMCIISTFPPLLNFLWKVIQKMGSKLFI